MIISRITNHHFCTKLEMVRTNRVKAGRSEPKLRKVSANCGTTFISRMAVTTMATTTTAVG